MTTIELTPEGIAPADVRRPICEWFKQHGIDPRHVPARNAIEVGANTMTCRVYAENDEGGYVLDSRGRPTTVQVSRALVEPFPEVNVKPVRRP